MGYAHYEIIRNGQQIEAGYAVETVCEKPGCTEKIHRGLAYLCGQTPGGDEYGCGGYFCDTHLHADQLCEHCSEAADEANTWTNPETGEEFDLRDEYLPEGERYVTGGRVWKHAGTFTEDGVPLLRQALSGAQPAETRSDAYITPATAITDHVFLVAGIVAWQQNAEETDRT